jgi:hypothetical protein
MLEAPLDVTCPHCWETVTLFVDLSISSQSYVEDCSVCCRPMLISFTTKRGEIEDVQVEAS